MHFFQPYYRASFQGGDTCHPLCFKPRVGWAGEFAAAHPMSKDPKQVTCVTCLIAMGTGKKRRKPSPPEDKAPPRRRNRHGFHIKAVWVASNGKMFPFCRPVAEQRERAA